MSSTIAICGSFSFDSVITPDGTPLTGKVGGNALWSSLGALLAGGSPRTAAVVGTDYPGEVIERISAAGIDVSAIRRIDREHPVRLTFAHLADGGRLQPVPDRLIAHLPPETRAMFRDTTGDAATLAQGAPTPDLLPSSWLHDVDVWHLPLLPLTSHRAMIDLLGSARGRVHSDCPARSDLLGAPYPRLEATLSRIDVFLPSTSDFDVIDPGAPVERILDDLRSVGARSVVLKAGADGAVVADGRRRWRVPAFPEAAVDPTGAGDAFCGGFLVGRAAGLDLVHATALGAASASFAVAVSDPLDLLGVDPAEVQRRADRLASAATADDDVLQGGTR